jgi:hypothetical protein
MESALVQDCEIEPARLSPFRECMENYDVGNPDEDWPHNVISTKTVAFSCGALHRPGEPALVHNHLLEELHLCRSIAADAEKLMRGVAVGMGSAASDCFAAYFVAASEGDPVTQTISEDLIRRAFGGSIKPGAGVRIEQVNETSSWWPAVLEFYAPDEDTGDSYDEEIGQWRAMMEWFRHHQVLRVPRFVSIGNRRDADRRGCVYPRLVVGLTPRGSLVGLCGYVVHA